VILKGKQHSAYILFACVPIFRGFC